MPFGFYQGHKKLKSVCMRPSPKSNSYSSGPPDEQPPEHPPASISLCPITNITVMFNFVHPTIVLCICFV